MPPSAQTVDGCLVAIAKMLSRYFDAVAAPSHMDQVTMTLPRSLQEGASCDWSEADWDVFVDYLGNYLPFVGLDSIGPGFRHDGIAIFEVAIAVVVLAGMASFRMPITAACRGCQLMNRCRGRATNLCLDAYVDWQILLLTQKVPQYPLADIILDALNDVGALGRIRLKLFGEAQNIMTRQSAA